MGRCARSWVSASPACSSLAASGSFARAAASTWNGTWDTEWGLMKLTQSGTKVTGTYPHDTGRISGTVSGAKFKGRWNEAPTRKGPGRRRRGRVHDERGRQEAHRPLELRRQPDLLAHGLDGHVHGRRVPAQHERRRRTAAPATGAVEPKVYGTDWADNARNLRGQTATSVFVCPAAGRKDQVWGPDVYTDNSSVCSAALHAGAIVYENGGIVTIQPLPGQASYTGSTRNGITSATLGAYPGSFKIVERDQGQRRPRREDGRRRLDGERFALPRPERRAVPLHLPQQRRASARSTARTPTPTTARPAPRPCSSACSRARTAAGSRSRSRRARAPTGHDRERRLEPAVDRGARQLHRSPAPRRTAGGGGGGGGGTTTTPAAARHARDRHRHRRRARERRGPFTTGTIPFGATVDVTNGRLKLTTDTGTLTVFGAAAISANVKLVRGTDRKKPITELRLVKGDFSVCPKRKPRGPVRRPRRPCVRSGARARAASARGSLASATVRGTYWLTADRCDGDVRPRAAGRDRGERHPKRRPRHRARAAHVPRDAVEGDLGRRDVAGGRLSSPAQAHPTAIVRRATSTSTLVIVNSEGLIEFRYADGAVVTGDYGQYAPRPLAKGDTLEYDGDSWLMYDREDRGGVTVHLFAPAETVTTAKMSRARTEKRGSGG